MRPSREIATIGEAQPVRRVPGGSGTMEWTGAGLPAATGFAVHRDAMNPIASAASATNAVATHPSENGRRDGTGAAGTLGTVSIHASPMSRSRFLGSRSRQRPRSVRTWGGVSGGSFE